MQHPEVARGTVIGAISPYIAQGLGFIHTPNALETAQTAMIGMTVGFFGTKILNALYKQAKILFIQSRLYKSIQPIKLKQILNSIINKNK